MSSFPERHRARLLQEADREDLARVSKEYVNSLKDLDALVDRIAEERRAAAKSQSFKGRAPRDQPKPIPLRSHEALGLRLIPKARTSKILIR